MIQVKTTMTTQNRMITRPMCKQRRNLIRAWLAAGLLVAGLAAPLHAQWRTEEPDIAKGIGVDQRLGEDLPLHLEFDNDKNNHVQLGQLFRDGKPVLLSFNYSDCPQLCVVQLQNLAAALQNIDLVPGQDFQIVSVSLDPTEQVSQLAEAKKRYVAAYGKLDSANGWHFLRSDKATIKELADACGFKYKYLPDQRQYSHPAAFIFCTSDGRIARYLDGLDGSLDKVLQPALMEAGEGRIGSLLDKVAYFAGCYYFDPTTGKYTMSAVALMRLAAVVTIVALIVGIAPYWVRRSIKLSGSDSTQESPLDPKLVQHTEAN